MDRALSVSIFSGVFRVKRIEDLKPAFLTKIGALNFHYLAGDFSKFLMF